RGIQIALPRSELPEAGEGEYYWSDLIGVAVGNQQGATLGAAESLMETGGNEVLVVRAEQGQRLIPIVDQYVLDVVPAEGRILVDWGLDY
ncbi:16S rRNA processing protein RimM, partial [Pseudomonas sp. MWU13-2625]